MNIKCLWEYNKTMKKDTVQKTKKPNLTDKKNDSVKDPEAGCNAITFAEQRKVLKEISDEKYRKFFYFCCCTGVRVCEALTIKCSDIDQKNNVIKITLTDSKTKKHKRKIPYHPDLLKDFELKRGKLLFEDITDEGSKQYFYKLYKKLNLNLSRHSTRHTFVSVCKHIGIDSKVVQNWVGHTDLKMTTNTYTHNLAKGTSPVLAYLTKLKKQNKSYCVPPKTVGKNAPEKTNSKT